MSRPASPAALNDKMLSRFTQALVAIDKNFIEGVYLLGSISLNDFHPNKSDIDFLVLCKKLPDDKTATQLKHIHQIIKKGYPTLALSGSYLSRSSIQSDDPQNIKTLSYHLGSMRYVNFEMGVVSLSELRSNAFTLLGQSAHTLPINITKIQLNKFLYQNINSYWKTWIKKHSSFFHRKILLLLFPRLTEWTVLGVARQLYTLKTGRIASKSEAGIYCLQHLSSQFHAVITSALEIRKDDRNYPFLKSYAVKPSLKRLRETINCANYIVDEFNRVYHTQNNR